LPSYNVRRFADPDALKRMRRQHLLALLSPYGKYFAGRGLVLSSADRAKINYQALADILLNPDDAMASPLVDALYYVNEMAMPEGMDELLEAAAVPAAGDNAEGVEVLDQGAELKAVHQIDDHRPLALSHLGQEGVLGGVVGLQMGPFWACLRSRSPCRPDAETARLGFETWESYSALT